MHSCIYEGFVEHRRYWPVEHRFRYQIFMMLFDLAELDQVFHGRWLWSNEGDTLCAFRRRDHFGDPGVPLDESVRRLVAERAGFRPSGPIRLLTQASCLGFVFNPISLFFCYDAAEQVCAIVAEVTNTPWGERHCYVLQPPDFDSPEPRLVEKAMHVSPFMSMDVQYRWQSTAPGAALRVDIQNLRERRPIFDVSLDLGKRPLNAVNLARAVAVYPLQTHRVLVRIYWQAMCLWLKGNPFHAHPALLQKNAPSSEAL